jgi:mannose-6-phosphate isomerase-like protein (cupin superfamily)
MSCAWWQLWLSPRPLQRTPVLTQESFDGTATHFDILQEPNGSWSIRETHHIENQIVRDGKSGPPMHYHRKQDEYFKVEQGVLGVIVDGQEMALTEDDDVLIIRANSRHRFWCHKSSDSSLVFRAWADPCKDEDHILDTNFLRNLISYGADCDKAGLWPSLFQLLVFAESASTVMIPPGMSWAPDWLIGGLQFALASWLGAGLLGYQASYPEYAEKERRD